jgi:hypothetical protein
MEGEYLDRNIKSWLERPGYSLSGTQLKLFSTAGDRVAVAALRALYPLRQLDDVRLGKILAAVSNAFQYPEMIQSEMDRVPAVTMCVLEMLANHVSLSEQKKNVQLVMDEIVSSQHLRSIRTQGAVPPHQD